MYRAILPDGEVACESYEMTNNGVELYDGVEQFIAFVPFSNLRELINEDVYSPADEESIH